MSGSDNIADRTKPPTASRLGAAYPHLMPAVELGAEVKPAWRRADPAIEADAKALWTRLEILPAAVDPEERAGEIVAAAYVDGQLAAISTAVVRYLEFLRGHFAMYRHVVAPEFRLHSVGRMMAGYSRAVLEAWALEHPEENLLGMGSVSQADFYQDRLARPVLRSSRLVLAGYTTGGHKLRIAWFDHVRV